MISKDVQEMIPKIQMFCGSQPIIKAWLFGSCSRGEESQNSDVDLLVEYDRRNARISLMKIAGMMIGLEDLYTFDQFKNSTLIFYGFTKYVEVIGEAVYMLTKEFRDSHPNVNWRQIEKMRHVGGSSYCCHFVG